MATRPTYFKSASEFRRWLARYHSGKPEIWVGFYKRDSGKRGISYREALDEALCFGWIDGLVKRVNDLSYMQRFTPRTARSTWSLINISRVGELAQLGRMAAPGLKAFAARDPRRSGIYSSENRHRSVLDAASAGKFRSKKPAWEYFQAQPPGYRRTAVWWVISAKQPETRARRLEKLIADSASQVRLAHLSPDRKK